MMRKLKAILGLFGFVAASVAIFALIFALMDLGDARREDRIVIGSKAFTESLLLAEVMARLIEEETGVRVERKVNLGGTHICFEALKNGEIDLYPEYTGTGLAAILKKPVVSDRARVLAQVRREFAERWELTWLDPMEFNNAYALAMTAEKAGSLGVRRISDLARHRTLVAGFPSEFMARDDGYPGLKKTYGLEFHTEPKAMEAGLMYGAVHGNKVDVIAAYATDGRIDKLGLRILEDDRGFFPPYQAAPLVRESTLRRHPKVRRALGVLAGKLTDAEMRRLNAAVDLDGRSIDEVASELIDTLR